jgi:hypothetical protein
MAILYLEEFGKAFIPKKVRPGLKQYCERAGLEDIPYKLVGGMFYISLVITIIIYLTQVYVRIKASGSLAFFLITFASVTGIELLFLGTLLLITYIVLNLKVFQRTRKIEERLADYLTLVSTNLKGGMSFENSLWAAIKPEFEILAREITIVSKKVMTGTDVGTALSEFAEKYDSPTLKRSINLIIGELESGGRVVNVIDKVIENLKKTKYLKQEMAASTLSYMIFISAIVMFVAPGLFALSSQLLKIINGFGAQLKDVNTGAMGFPVKFESTVLPEDYRVFAILALLIISIFSGMLISIIEHGHIKAGLKYILLFVVVSMVMYFLFTMVLGNVFSGLMPTT